MSMNIVDILNLNEFDAARAANPNSIVRLVLGDGKYTLFFPKDHPIRIYEVR
jgi:hypothetical protein